MDVETTPDTDAGQGTATPPAGGTGEQTAGQEGQTRNDSTSATPSADNTQQVHTEGTEGHEGVDTDARQEEQPDPENSPITDWTQVKLDLPENMLDQAVLGSFGKAAVELGLTPRQAQALASWQIDMIAEQRQALMDAGVQELSRDWGSRVEANQQSVLALISRIDRMTGNDAFSKALGASGATCFPGVVKGLLAIARMISEDSVGAAGAAGMSEHDETALEGLNAALKEAQRRR